MRYHPPRSGNEPTRRGSAPNNAHQLQAAGPHGREIVSCTSCGTPVGTLDQADELDEWHVTNLERPLRPDTAATALKYTRGRAFDWLMRQHLYAWIRQPSLTSDRASTRIDTMSDDVHGTWGPGQLTTDSAPSKSKVGQVVTWTCSSCGETVGTTWRDSDGLHAESTWNVQLPWNDNRDHWTRRDFSQTVARARDHLAARHLLDVRSRHTAIDPESTSVDTAGRSTTADAGKDDLHTENRAPIQDTLPWDALAEQAALGVVNQAVAQLNAALGAINSRGRREQAIIQALDQAGDRMRTLALTRAKNAIYQGLLRQTHVAAALGISRQAVNQRLR